MVTTVGCAPEPAPVVETLWNWAESAAVVAATDARTRRRAAEGRSTGRGGGRRGGVAVDEPQAATATAMGASRAATTWRWGRLAVAHAISLARGMPAQRSSSRIWAASWWSPAAGGRASSRAIWSGSRRTPSAATFSSTRVARLVPGIGTTESPWARSQASATWAGRGPHLDRDRLDLVGDGQVALEIPVGETGVVPASVVRAQVVDRSGTPRSGTRDPGASRARTRCPVPRGPGGPRRGDRGSTASTRTAAPSRGARRGPDGWCRPMPRTGRCDAPCPRRRAGEGADRVLDGSVRIDAVLVVEVDVVGAQPSERSLDRGADVGRTAVEMERTTPGVGDHAELGGQHHLVAAIGDGPTDQLLVGVGAVDLSGVDEGDSQVERPVDGPDRLGVVAARLRCRRRTFPCSRARSGRRPGFPAWRVP